VLCAVLGGLALLHNPRWYPQFLLYFASACVMVPFAENAGVARDLVLKILLLNYLLAVGSLTFIKTVDKARLLVLVFFLQFPWWIVQTRFTDSNVGQTVWRPIGWHPNLGNTDGFAPLMVIGAAFAFYYGVATRERFLRWLAFASAAACVVGMVAAYTRGASLAFGVVLVYAWLRSPSKGRTFGRLAFAALVFLLATSVIYSGGGFWARLATITSEGVSAGTGQDRWQLWQMGWEVFKQRPVLGVGAGNFGIFAFHHLPPDQLLGPYLANRGALYGRPLHSICPEILSEFGAVGMLAFVALLVDFWRRNKALRSAAFVAGWRHAAPEGPDLTAVSLGLEAAMVAFLITGVFYDQLFVHWVYSLVTVNAVVHATAARAAAIRMSAPSSH